MGGACIHLQGKQSQLKMSQLETLWIINATSKNLKLTGVHSTLMNQWSFTDIQAQSQSNFAIEFKQSGSGAKADVTFQLEGTNTRFQLQASDATGQQLQVDWSSTDPRQYTVFPPLITGATAARVRWLQNGTACVLIQDKPALLPSPSQLSNLGTQWMEHYSDVIHNLTLTEMCIPGTHDSGTYQPDFVLGREWIRTQILSLRNQLNLGIRSLDLRIGQNKPGDYIITHDTWKTKYSLSQALTEVVDFIKATKVEIVILDFHRFNILNKGSSFDFDQLKAQVKSTLGGYFVPAPEGVGKTLFELWHRPNAAQERIIITWNDDGSIDCSYMWPGVDQHWYSTADSQDKLFTSLSTDFTDPPPRDKMWASCVFRTASVFQTPFVNAKDLRGKVDSWFYGCADWSLKANILMTDFCPDYNNVIHAAICASLLNGNKKQSLH